LDSPKFLERGVVRERLVVAANSTVPRANRAVAMQKSADQTGQIGPEQIGDRV
jgi:hypothetical protein